MLGHKLTFLCLDLRVLLNLQYNSVVIYCYHFNCLGFCLSKGEIWIKTDWPKKTWKEKGVELYKSLLYPLLLGHGTDEYGQRGQIIYLCLFVCSSYIYFVDSTLLSCYLTVLCLEIGLKLNKQIQKWSQIIISRLT